MAIDFEIQVHCEVGFEGFTAELFEENGEARLHIAYPELALIYCQPERGPKRYVGMVVNGAATLSRLEISKFFIYPDGKESTLLATVDVVKRGTIPRDFPCPQCKRAVPNDAMFCPGCGCALDSWEPT